MTGPSNVLMSDTLSRNQMSLTHLYPYPTHHHWPAPSARLSPSLYSQMRDSPYTNESFMYRLEYLIVSMTKVSNFVSLKLSGSRNYLLWKAQMVCLLESQNMYGIVDSSFSGPKYSSPGISRRYDSLVRSWIFGSVTKDVLVNVRNLDSAKAVWEKLKSIYDPTVCLQEGLEPMISPFGVRRIFLGPPTPMALGITDNLRNKFDKFEDSHTNHPCKTMAKLYRQRLVKVEQSMKNTAESFSITAALITAILFAAGIVVPDASNKESEMLTIKVKTPLFIFVISNAISLFASNTALLVFLSILAQGFAEKDFLLGLPRKLFIGLCSFFLCIAAMIVAFSASLFLVFCDQNPWKLVLICGLLFSAIAFSLTLQFPIMVDLFKSTYLGIFGKQRKRHVVRDFKLFKNLCEVTIEGDGSEVESMLNKERLATQAISSNGCTVLQLAAETATKENDVGFCEYLDSCGLLAELTDMEEENNKDNIHITTRKSRTEGKIQDWRLAGRKRHSFMKSHQGDVDFLVEMKVLSSIQHGNIVSLSGNFGEEPQLIILYEFAKNKSLDYNVYGIARDIQYLHEGSHKRIIHLDVKPKNILLDDKLQPKVGDFGLSRFFLEDQAYLRTTFARTFGYTTPKYAIRGELFKETNIYSFGAAIHEIISCRRNTALTISSYYLPEHVVRALLTHKGTINKEVINKYGEIPLHTTEKFNRSGIAITLQQHGVTKAKSIKNTGPPSTQTTRNSTTVIPVLIATVTLAAIFQLPSQYVDKSNQILNGFSSDEGSIASNPEFIVFLIFDISALFISLAIVVLQTSTVMVGKRAKKQVMAVINKLMWLACVFVSVAFVALSLVVDGHKKWLAVGVKIVGSVTLASTRDDVLLDNNEFGL